jgi:RimJ/RimL family protein N-acetyltransferase
MDLSNVVITTDRLKIVPVKEEFAQMIFQETIPEVTKYLSFDASGKIEDTIQFISSAQPKIAAGEDMPVAVFDKVTNEFIGCSGVHYTNTTKPEIGIWIKVSAQGKGYGKEIVTALIEWIKKNIKYEYIVYPVAKANMRSRKLIESLGGKAAKEQLFVSKSGKQFEEVEYRIY